MKYIDSNVLIRIITGDNPKAAHLALQTIEAAAQGEYIVDTTVLVEVCFVLEFHDYKMQRKDIADALLALASATQVSMSKQAVNALTLYKKHTKLDFTDCLLFVLGGKDGVYTFDKEFSKTLLKTA